MKLKTVQDDDYNLIKFSKEINHGDFTFRFAIKLTYLEEYGDDVCKGGKYSVCVDAVSPESAGKDKVIDAIESWTDDQDVINQYLSDPYTPYLTLLEYGISATLFHKQGNNKNQLLKDASKELKVIDMLFGFYMDKYQNRIGNTGWDFISGNIGWK
jgi:hypothetical protein